MVTVLHLPMGASVESVLYAASYFRLVCVTPLPGHPLSHLEVSTPLGSGVPARHIFKAPLTFGSSFPRVELSALGTERGECQLHIMATSALRSRRG